MNRKKFQPGVSLCGCGNIAFEWKCDAPVCSECLRRESISLQETSGYAPPRHVANLSVDATFGAPTMRDLTILESAV